MKRKRYSVEQIMRILREAGGQEIAKVCRENEISEQIFYRSRKRSDRERSLVSQKIALSLEKPTYGYRFITAVLKNAGCLVNHKKVQSVRRKEGLAARANSRKLVRRGVSTGERKCARFPGDVWCCDFIFDTTEDGRTLKILSVVDEFSRFCLVLRCARRIDSSGVIDALEGAFRRPSDACCRFAVRALIIHRVFG
jgi:putative transposase